MLVGIDLGTTNSLIGIWRDGQPALIPNALGDTLTPSVVSILDNGEIVIGKAARDRLITDAEKTASTFKRYMGTDRKIPLGKKSFRPEELSAFVLRALKADAEAFLGEPVTEAIVTVPAYFNDAQRKATKAAGQLANLKVDRLLTEPTAAALAYGFTGAGAEDTILVIDLGGGTLDVSLLHSFEGIMEVKATAGDIWLGGEDFTDALVGIFMKKAPGADAIEFAQNRQFHGALRRQAESAKRTLADQETATIAVNNDQRVLQCTISRDEFEQASEPLLTKVRLPLERAVRDSRVAPNAISRIIFAGGASRMPMLRRLVSRLFRQFPINTINPDEVVARGAAVRAGLASRSVGLEEHILTDVAPFTLGVNVGVRGTGSEHIDGMFLPIIERNTVIPTSRSHVLTTLANNQARVQIGVYQGEARFVRDNVFLGEIVADVPPGPPGSQFIDVRFTYDTSGLLAVDATVLSTKHSQSLLIEGNPGVLTQAQIADRLAAMERLKVHPRDDAENVALVARSKRLFEENLGDLRYAIGNVLDALMLAIESQDPDRIARIRTETTNFLDTIDKGVWD